MGYPKRISDQLKNVTPKDIIQALLRDGWVDEGKKSAARGFSRIDEHTNKRRYMTVHYHRGKTYGKKQIYQLLHVDAGFSEDDLKRHKFIKR